MWICLKRFMLHPLLSKLFKPLLGRTRSRGRCWAAIRLSHRPEPSGHAVHTDVDGLDIGGQHGRRFVLLCHTHRPQRKPCPVCTSRSGNVQPRCGGSQAGLSAHSAWWSAHCAARMLLSDKLMRCCAACTNGCLDLNRRASALDGRASAEWSRCAGSTARRAGDSVAPLRW